MFLHYLSRGSRAYHRTWAGQTHVHPFWELSVAARGSIAPVIPGCRLAPRPRCPWAIPGGQRHGWTGDGSPAEVVVICPRWVPNALAHAASLAARERQLPTWEMTPPPSARSSARRMACWPIAPGSVPPPGPAAGAGGRRPLPAPPGNLSRPLAA